MRPRRTKDARSGTRTHSEAGSARRVNHLRIVGPFSPDSAPDGEPDGDASRAETGPTPRQLTAVLGALAEVTVTSLAYLRLTTDMPGPLLGMCVEALAGEGLLTAEDRSDGHDGRRTVALTAAGRRAYEALEKAARPLGGDA